MWRILGDRNVKIEKVYNWSKHRNNGKQNKGIWVVFQTTYTKWSCEYRLIWLYNIEKPQETQIWRKYNHEKWFKIESSTEKNHKAFNSRNGINWRMQGKVEVKNKLTL